MGARRRRRDAGPLAPDRRRGDPRRSTRARAWLSHRQHVHSGPASAPFRGLRGARRCSDRAAKGQLPGCGLIGVRPMFDGQVPNLETFLFDFSGDLYGTHMSVALVEYLRDEQKFDGHRQADRADGRRLRPRPRNSGSCMKDPIQREGLRPRFWESVPLKNLTPRRMGSAVRRLRQVLPEQA